jgi:hypothetical protein
MHDPDREVGNIPETEEQLQPAVAKCRASFCKRGWKIAGRTLGELGVWVRVVLITAKGDSMARLTVQGDLLTLAVMFWRWERGSGGFPQGLYEGSAMAAAET